MFFFSFFFSLINLFIRGVVVSWTLDEDNWQKGLTEKFNLNQTFCKACVLITCTYVHLYQAREVTLSVNSLVTLLTPFSHTWKHACFVSKILHLDSTPHERMVSRRSTSITKCSVFFDTKFRETYNTNRVLMGQKQHLETALKSWNTVLCGHDIAKVMVHRGVNDFRSPNIGNVLLYLNEQ